MAPRLTPTRSGSSPLSRVPPLGESGVAPGLPGGEHGELCGPVHPPGSGPGEQRGGVHGHDARDPYGQFGELLALQLPYPVPPVEQPPPQFVHPGAQRGHGPQPGHDDPSRPCPRGLACRPCVMQYDVSRPVGVGSPGPYVVVGDGLAGPGPGVQILVPDPPPPLVRHLDALRIDGAQPGDGVPVVELDGVQAGRRHGRHGRRVHPPPGDDHLLAACEDLVVIHASERRSQSHPDRLG